MINNCDFIARLPNEVLCEIMAYTKNPFKFGEICRMGHEFLECEYAKIAIADMLKHRLIITAAIPYQYAPFIIEINLKKRIDISMLYNLKWLDCKGLNINDSQISNLISLEWLDCSNCKLLTNLALKNCVSLKSLTCRNCRFAISAFKLLPKLEFLHSDDSVVLKYSKMELEKLGVTVVLEKTGYDPFKWCNNGLFDNHGAY
jgi:hypothetical protein